MKYVKLIGQPLRIEKGPCALPKAQTGISGFSKLSHSELAKHGWYPWREVAAPTYDRRKVHLVSEVAIDAEGRAHAVHSLRARTNTEIREAFEQSRAEKLEELAARRYRAETAGVMWRGRLFASDRESVTAVSIAAMQGHAERWKCADGQWVTLEAEALTALAKSLTDHRRRCFAREAYLHGLIVAAEDFDTLDAIELETGWPSSLV